MLLSFKTRNYKSFKDKILFSMEPAPKQKGLDYSILNEPCGKKIHKGLSSSVIYGPNSTGKTNLIGAISTFKSIVMSGNINNKESRNTNNISEFFLEFIPNRFLTKLETTLFQISFIENKHIYTYSLEIDLGLFLDTNYDRSIVTETLSIDSKTVFKRNQLKVEINYNSILKTVTEIHDDANEKTINIIAEKSLNKKELFLTNGFKSIVSNELASLITNYFDAKLGVFYHADHSQYKPQYEQKIVNQQWVTDAAQAFGSKSENLVYIRPENKAESVLCSVIQNKAIPADIIESYGTIRFVNLLFLLVQALLTGSTLFIDEFDSSLHPKAVMSLINIFHNDDINKNHAQLIFNTHNPLYLNSNNFRRDEIKFVDFDEDKQTSILYSLSDFGTKGTTARKGQDYMNNYFINKYGAIRDIDFTEIFEELMKKPE